MINVNEHYELLEHPRNRYRTIKIILAFTGIKNHNIKTKYFHLKEDGVVEIFVGYAWDGCSGVPDLLSTMLASLLHDIGYQCLREELLIHWGDYHRNTDYYADFVKYRKRIDQLFKWTMKKDGAWWITQKVYYRGVRILGEKYALPEMLKSA